MNSFKPLADPIGPYSKGSLSVASTCARFQKGETTVVKYWDTEEPSEYTYLSEAQCISLIELLKTNDITQTTIYPEIDLHIIVEEKGVTIRLADASIFHPQKAFDALVRDIRNETITPETIGIKAKQPAMA